MIIHDLDIVRITLRPGKADPPLVIDTNTVLPLPITLQSFQPISRRNQQITERSGTVENQKLPSRSPFNATEPQHILIEKQRFRLFRAKGTDHWQSVYSASRHRSSATTRGAGRGRHARKARRGQFFHSLLEAD